jgi:hypothetical protein
LPLGGIYQAEFISFISIHKKRVKKITMEACTLNRACSVLL